MPNTISIVGTSNSGKTTLLEKLIPELKRRGYKIGTVKHAHNGFDFDRKGKDSWRHQMAGADTVVVASPGRIAMVKNKPCERLDSLDEYFGDMDLVITEGYKRENRPKIEIYRTETGKPPIFQNHPDLIAYVTDGNMEGKTPVFGLDDISELADFIEQNYIVKKNSIHRKIRSFQSG